MTSGEIPYTVLVVDDSAFSREWLTGILQHLGFQKIDIASNGVAAMEKIKTTKPDIVFLDAVMPEMDGLTTLKELKKLLPDAIVVITSSSSTKEVVLEFKEAGAHYYLRKPLEASKLRETIGKALEMMEHRQEAG